MHDALAEDVVAAALYLKGEGEGGFTNDLVKSLGLENMQNYFYQNKYKY